MTEKDYIKKHLILDAIKSAKPEPSEYMDMTDNIAVNTIILGAAAKQYEDIVKIVEAAQPTECKPVVRGEMGNLNDVYISREQAIDAIEREFEDDIMGAVKAKEAVYSVDLADVSMNVHGYWKKYTHYNVVGISEGYQCSVCGESIGYNEYGNYKFSCFCHECGATMDAESEGNNATDGTANTGR